MPKLKTGLNEGEFCSVHNEDFREYEYRKWCCFSCYKEKKKDAEKNRCIARYHSELNLSKRFKNCTLDSFTAKTKEQKEVKKKIVNYLSRWPDVGGVVMIGGVGTGKTHLSSALCSALCDKEVPAITTTVNRIIREVRSCWGNRKPTDNYNNELSESDIILKHTEVSFLVIDEIGSQYGSDSEKIIINEIINDRYEQEKPTVVIGNLTRSEINDILGERVYDRLMHNGIELIFGWDSQRKKRQ